VVAPLFAARHLPFTDLPEHAAVSAALAHWDDPAWRFDEYFSFSPAVTPYWLYDAFGAVLTRITGDAVLSHTLMLACVGLLFPLSATALVVAMGKDPRLGALGAAAFWSRALQYGLLPFVSSVPVLIFAVAGMVMLLRGRARTSTVVITTVLACTLPLLHVVSFLVFLVTSLGLVFLFRRKRGRAWNRLSLIPFLSVGIFLFYVVGARTSGAFGTELRFSSPVHTLMAFPAWSFDLWSRRDEKAFAALYWLGYLGVFVTGVRRREPFFPMRAWPLLVVVLLVFLFPSQIGAGSVLNWRLGPLLSLALLPLVSLRRAPAWRARLARASLVVALVGMAGQCWIAADEVRGAQRDLGDFDAIVDAVPYGSRVLFLPFDMERGDPRFFPWLHAGGLIRARKGGLSQYSFTSMPHWPLHDLKSPRKGKSIWWDRAPCFFEPDTDGLFYDAIVVHGPYDPFVGRTEGERHEVARDFTPTVSAPPFTLWQRVEPSPSAPTMTLAPAPCDRWGPPRE
jgi:hypothetical protein